MGRGAWIVYIFRKSQLDHNSSLYLKQLKNQSNRSRVLFWSRHTGMDGQTNGLSVILGLTLALSENLQNNAGSFRAFAKQSNFSTSPVHLRSGHFFYSVMCYNGNRHRQLVFGLHKLAAL